MLVSIKDVAERANVSRGTVSHVLNGRTSARIAPETQERVRRAASELGYVPNQMAKSIFRTKTGLIGVVATGILNPFYAEMIGASETAIADAGYRRLVDASAPALARARPEILSVWPVDGIIMHGAVGRVAEGILGARVVHVPVVYLDSPADWQRDTVQFDLGPAMDAAANVMIAKGHARFGIVSPYSQFDLNVKQRHQSLLQACHDLGLSCQHFKLQEETRSCAVRLGVRIAGMPPASRPTAVFCHNDNLAIGIYHGLLRGGVRIPEEVAVIGSDGIGEGECLDKPLSTIMNPVDDLCRIGVELLLERIGGAEIAQPRHITVASTYVERATS